jgi:hypothetical protein
MADFVKDMAIRQRRRLVAAMMEHFERKIYGQLPLDTRSEISQEFRAKVMAAVGQYHDVVLDLLGVGVAEGTVFNQEAFELLQSIHAQVTSGS